MITTSHLLLLSLNWRPLLSATLHKPTFCIFLVHIYLYFPDYRQRQAAYAKDLQDQIDEKQGIIEDRKQQDKKEHELREQRLL